MKLTGGFFFTFRQLIGNIHKQYDYQNKSHGYLNIGTNFPEIHFSNFLSNQTVNGKKTIPRVIDNVKLKKSSGFCGKVILGPMKTLANQPADRLMDNPEKALRYGRNFFFFIQIILTPFKRALFGSIMN